MGNISGIVGSLFRPAGLNKAGQRSNSSLETKGATALDPAFNPYGRGDANQVQKSASFGPPGASAAIGKAFAAQAAQGTAADSLKNLDPRVRADLLASLSRAGLSPDDTRTLTRALAQNGQPEALKSLALALKNSQPAQIRSFSRAFQALSAPEQSAGLEISRLLLINPAPTDLRAQLAKRVNALSAAADGGKGMAMGRALNSLGLYLPALSGTTPGAEDASGRLRQVVMGEYSSVDQQGYVRDMIATARKEGFQITLQVRADEDLAALRQQIFDDLATTLNPPLSKPADLDKLVKLLPSELGGSTWAEDNKWISGDGTVVTLPDADKSLAKLARFVSFDTGARPGEVGSEGHHTAGQDSFDPDDLVPFFSTQGAVSGNADSYGYRADVVNDVNRDEYRNAKALAAALGRPVRTVRFYNEGGNMLSGTMPNGEPYAVIGRDGLIVSAFQLEATSAADPNQVPEFAPAKEQAAIAALGLDKPFQSLSLEQQSLIEHTFKRLQAAGEKFTTMASARSRAVQFLAHLELSKDVFAQDLGIDKQRLVFVAQPEFHIDMHLRPLAPGQVMINDFDANDKLLAAALAKAAPASWEFRELEGMRQHNARLKEVMAPVMDQIASELKAGGLEVVRAPGVMQGLMHNPALSIPSDAQVRHVNFMNAIPATKLGSNQQMYITNYTSLAPLREAYADYLRTERGIDSLHWIGIGGGETNKSPSELSLDLEGGLDCRENH